MLDIVVAKGTGTTLLGMVCSLDPYTSAVPVLHFKRLRPGKISLAGEFCKFLYHE